MGEGIVNILFICTGNTCRSVMAQGLFQKMWDEIPGKKLKVKACSAGVSAFNGIGASPDAREILREEGVDLSKHLSRMLVPEMVSKASYIYTMTKDHKNYLLANYPEAADKIFLLNKHTGESEEEDISDPIGLGREHYRETAGEIKKALGKIIEKLIEEEREDKAGNNN